MNCDEAGSIGEAVQTRLDGVHFYDATIKKSDQIRTLAELQHQQRKSSSAISIDPSVLFNRILVLVERSTDIESYFHYELSSVPTALFKDNMMRKANKPALAKYITGDGECSKEVNSSSTQHVLDGGCLLHRVRWFRNVVYRQVVTQYVDFVRTRYKPGTVIVFDGYPDQPSPKDHEHERRRSRQTTSCPEVDCDDAVRVIFSQEIFLSNDKNKDRLIKKLIPKLNLAGFTAWQSAGDADVDIVSAALHIASTTDDPLSVVANDTDILVMLTYHVTAAMSDILLCLKLEAEVL